MASTLFFLSFIGNIAPLKEVRIKQRTESWINYDILQSMKDRANEFQAYKRKRSDEIM